MHRNASRGGLAASLTALLFLGAVPAAAQSITGFGTAAAAREHTAEARLVESIHPAELDSISYALTREVHVAGSPAQARTRDWVLNRTRGFGLKTESKEYTVYMPWPTSVSLEMTAPQRRTFELKEATLPGDPTSALPQYPWVNGYSGVGTAAAPVVYVNYGLYEDYALLDSMGVSLQGKIAIARYGHSYRGIKARLAEQHGAVGLVIYSDPEDDGYVRGDVFPDGPFRNPTATQRGSIMNGDGDPTTPDYASVAGAKRLNPDSTGFETGTIPIIPVSYSVAQPILAALGGKDLPSQDWQGGLPFRYHVGPGPAALRMSVTDDRNGPEHGMKKIWDTFAWVPGSERPDEWIIIGGHRDAWDAGANDNVSGTAAVLAAAHAVADLVKSGQRPRRTLVFATWDAEEWGLLGSTEWVEEMAKQLGAKAVAYFNMDAGATGSHFGSSAAPALKSFMRDVTKAVPSPKGGTVYEQWVAQRSPSDTTTGDVRLGNLGGGSDFAGFYNHLGIPSADWGFGGGSGEYHSAYDDYTFESTYADPGYKYHATNAKIAAVAAMRMADAQVLPYDYAEFSTELRGVVAKIRKDAGTANTASLDRLDAAFARLGAAADSLAAARDAFLAGPAPAAAANTANHHLLEVERSLLRPEGLPRRPWFRNLTVASDYKNGYATILLPGVADAAREKDYTKMAQEADDLASRLDTAAGHLREATAALR